MGKRRRFSDLAAEEPSNSIGVPGLDEYNATRTSVRVAEVAPNPLNPREQLGDLKDLVGSFQVRGQLQPCTVVSRKAYLARYPEHEDIIGKATYVAVAGSRRRAAAEEAGLDMLLITVQNQIAETRESLAAAAIAENVDRVNLDPLEEAGAVQALCDMCGSQREAAARLGKSQGWISQRIALLGLSSDMRKELRAGRLQIRDARRLAKEPAETQLLRWHEEQAAAAAADYPVITGADTNEDRPAPASKGREPAAPPGPQPKALIELEGKLIEKLDTVVKVQLGRTKGKLVVEFGSVDDLERIADTILKG